MSVRPEVSPDGEQIAFDSYFRPRWQRVAVADEHRRHRPTEDRTRELQRQLSEMVPRQHPRSRTSITLTDGGLGIYVYDLAAGRPRFVTTGTIESWIDDVTSW